MDWIERLNKAMEYLEEHMTEEIPTKRRRVLHVVPPIIFRGWFAYMANVPLRIYPPQEDVSGC